MIKSSLSTLGRTIQQLWQRHSLWRLSILVAVMLWLTVALALFAVYQLSIQPLVRSKHQLISQHVEQLNSAAELNNGSNIEQWLDDTLYENQNILTVIKSPNGHVSGALSHIPNALPTCPSIAPFPIIREGNDAISILEGCSFKIHDHQVLIATNNEYIREIQENFVNAALTIMALSFFIALIPGWIIRRKISHQLNAINHVVGKIEQGHFDSRIPLAASKPEFAQDEWARIGLFINRMLNEVESSVNQIQGVTDAIAHDLRTPLTRIKNRLTAAEQEPDPTKKALALNELHHHFDEILVTFNAMLELSKLEALRETDQFGQVDFEAIAKDAIELIEPMLDDKQQTISLTSTPCHLHGDRSLLFRMLYNLIDNAHKYSPKGASITLEITPKQMTLTDTGPGIAPNLRHKVFQRLYRVDTSRNTPGHGLGLALVAAVVKLHGASISLDYANQDEKIGLCTTILFAEKDY
ncbi:sensor histidine kinase [Vibrio agarivorans]|uniref:histidine kinase n=1 Tax=Vibrio agarivorans TaxID=153622 RepID=A0ABT7XXY9_9VIBR|nr:HAMP domain-containing sensor histidine kinase [Vibrio agarivorans]